MRNGKRGRYALEFKQEAVRLVESGQSVASAAGNLRSGGADLVQLGEGTSCRNVAGGGRQECGTGIGGIGGPGRDRTDDLFHAMEARSQLRHRPTLRRE
jgi:hypothetical protein